jgi:hypothetical protein
MGLEPKEPTKAATPETQLPQWPRHNPISRPMVILRTSSGELEHSLGWTKLEQSFDPSALGHEPQFLIGQ